MVPPAEEHTVVGVRWAAFGMFSDVVELAPARRHAAPWNDARTVAEDDRLALPVIEHAVNDAQALDAAVLGTDALERGSAVVPHKVV